MTRGRCRVNLAGTPLPISIRKFGNFEGQRVDEAHLTSGSGVEVSLLNWGVRVRDWRVPVRSGLRPIVLGFEAFDPYPKHGRFFGAVVGRVANRIAGSSFMIGGRHHRVRPNEGTTCLHGGPEGLSHQVWRMQTDEAENAVRFTHRSLRGHSGFPGAVDFTATYQLAGSRLDLDLVAEVDEPTPINLVQHHYFNLGSGADILDHRFQMDAETYTPVDAQLIPTGEILPVDGTPFDFRKARSLRDAEGGAIDYDINLVLRSPRDAKLPVATVVSPQGDLNLNLFSDQPGLQFYSGGTIASPGPGLRGLPYGPHSGFCLEDQKFPDAPHHPEFPSILVTPDAPYRHRVNIEIGGGQS